jgi:hypothetical protein
VRCEVCAPVPATWGTRPPTWKARPVGGALGASVGYALGIAISPIPIAALILALLSVRPRTNSAAFTVGWTVGIGAVATFAAVTSVFDGGDDPSDRRGWIRLTIGVVMVVVGVLRWRSRPRADEEPPIPPLMRAMDGAGTLAVLGIGFALAAFNPKDLVLAAAGGVEIGSADLGRGATAFDLAIFTAIAASTALVPVGAYLIAGDRLDEPLRRSRTWLIRHNAVVVAVVLVAVGVLFVVESFRILSD